MSLLSLVLTLQPLEVPSAREEFPRWWGRASQAALLEVVRQANPALAEWLHASSPASEAQSQIANSLRPYTASTLMGKFNRQSGAPLPGETYSLRWTSLTAELTALLLEFAQHAAGNTLELDHIPFSVAAAHVTESQPWAGQDSYGALGSRFLPGVEIPRRVSFQFVSPVVFKSGGLSHPLPTASLVFNSLIEKWNAFAPVAFMPELRRYAEECLAVSRFDLESRAVPLKEGGMRIGAVGQITFTAANFDRFWLGQIHTLAAFALFSGIGAGTTQGLGQARRMIDD
ncbi:MAG TPA: CRISPR system precrRNA processing endoribonuclease RAMP protein Cas6 [Anaerolineales bacterium]|nr:CRISPR system precrRNA processing endoribonuclease RAMP protein Cas6 [Anaerolineales bacterium]